MEMCNKPEGIANYFEDSFKMICRVVDFSMKAPFWKRKLMEAIPRNIEEFRQFPITTREEVNELYDNGRCAELLTGSLKKSYVTVSSGGRPYRSPFVSCLTRREFEEMIAPITNMFAMNGITNGSILITFPGVMPYLPSLAGMIWPASDIEEYRSSHISGILFKQASIRANLKTFCSGLRLLAYKVSEEEALIERERVMRAYSIVKPNILAVSPNVLRNVFFPELHNRAHRFGDYNTKIIISGGSKLLEGDLENICCLGNPKIIVWVESGEIGTIGYSKAFQASCPDKSFYYTSWRENFFETVAEDGNALPFGSRGRIVVTRLKTFVQPLIRYDLEDEGKFSIIDSELVLGWDILKL